MSYLSRFNPVGGFTDLWHELRRPTPHRWPILVVSCLLTGLMIWSFTREKVYLPPDKPKVVFIRTFAADRSLEEIRRSNRANQAVQDRLRAEQAARDDAAKDAYRALGRASGMDVAAMEREAAAEAAREQAAERARLKALLIPPSAPADASAQASHRSPR